MSNHIEHHNGSRNDDDSQPFYVHLFGSITLLVMAWLVIQACYIT